LAETFERPPHAARTAHVGDAGLRGRPLVAGRTGARLVARRALASRVLVGRGVPVRAGVASIASIIDSGLLRRRPSARDPSRAQRESQHRQSELEAHGRKRSALASTFEPPRLDVERYSLDARSVALSQAHVLFASCSIARTVLDALVGGFATPGCCPRREYGAFAPRQPPFRSRLASSHRLRHEAGRPHA
jgi:hypothetical protein